MEAILVNKHSGERRIENFSVQEYYDFASNTEYLKPGHCTIYKNAAENAIKELCWDTIYSIQRDYPKTDLTVSEETVKELARKEIVSLLRRKIDEYEQIINRDEKGISC
jgi:hypothetical protein